MFLAAVIQLNCTSNEDRNWAQCDSLVRRAAKSGARFVATPECTNYLGPHDKKVRIAEPVTGPTIQRYGRLASELGLWFLVGSFNERAPDPSRCYNTSVLLGPDGKVHATYRKVHLFDVDHSDAVRFLESNTTVAGTAPVTCATPLGTIGMSICYDLRFPEHYRNLIDQGATLLTVPSAFTATTGKDHWEPLLRARAIESQAYVLAPGQVGHHDDDGLRDSHGHSMIVDPWGKVIACCPSDIGIALAEINPERVKNIRKGMPCRNHRVLGVSVPGSTS
jgi:predicted amidohydrolase